MDHLKDRNQSTSRLDTPSHELPALPYDYAALEPCIDARTMQLHHDVHHGGYVKKLNEALTGLPEFQQATAPWLLCNLDQIPRTHRDAIHHNAGGHVNHSLFWESMKPGGGSMPAGALRDAICRSFGTIDAFKKSFVAAGAGLFGSGWVWLVAARTGGDKLEIMTTAGHDHPMMKHRVALLLNDVWEHAYYLHYQNRREDYLNAWWSVVDWAEVSRRYLAPDEQIDRRRADPPPPQLMRNER